jgi:kinesin family protein 1
VNEDPNAKLIRELKEELATLRQRMIGASSAAGEASYDPDVPPERQIVKYRTQTGEIKTITKAELQDQLEQSEKLMASVTETWEQKLVKTQEIQKEREQALEALGITIEKNLVGVHAPKKVSQRARYTGGRLLLASLTVTYRCHRSSIWMRTRWPLSVSSVSPGKVRTETSLC